MTAQLFEGRGPKCRCGEGWEGVTALSGVATSFANTVGYMAAADKRVRNIWSK